jgi:1-acyl-sn-glycerol-3-phosphate acyltransferase
LAVDAKWLVKAELFRYPFLGWMLRMAGDIPVERSDRRKGAKALLQCARSLRQGCSIVCFPEGTRSRDGQVGPFSEGPFQMAIREKVPVLPLVVEGSAAALPRNSWIFGGNQTVRLSVLKPVSVDGLGTERSAELRDEVRREIVDELRRLRVLGA